MEENKRFLKDDEINCIRKMFRIASITKYSLIAACATLLPLFVLVINDFIRFYYSVPRGNILIYVYVVMGILAVLLTIWAIYYITLRRNLIKNKTWQEILEKISSKDKLEQELKRVDAATSISLAAYFLGDLVAMSKELEEVGNVIKTISGMALIWFIIKNCTIVIEFAKKASKVYNFSLNFNAKTYCILFLLPGIMVLIYNIGSTALEIYNGKKLKENIITSLTNNCNEKSYCESVTTYRGFYDDIITILLTRNPYSYSEITLNRNKKVKRILYSFSYYDKNISREEIVEDVNKKLVQLNDIIKTSNTQCEYDFLCKQYQLSDNFISKFYNATTDDLSEKYDVGNNYTVSTYSYNEEDRISIHLDIDDL